MSSLCRRCAHHRRCSRRRRVVIVSSSSLSSSSSSSSLCCVVVIVIVVVVMLSLLCRHRVVVIVSSTSSSLSSCRRCLSVCHTSVFCRQSTPFNISAIFTARRICIARTIPWQHVCPTTRSLCLSDSPSSIIRQASHPVHMNFLFVSVFQYTYLSITFVRTMSCLCLLHSCAILSIHICLSLFLSPV